MRSAACAGRFFLGFSEGAELRILGCSTLSRFKFNVYNPPPACPQPPLDQPRQRFYTQLTASIILFCLKGGLLRCRQGVDSRQARRPPLLPYNQARQGDGASDAGQLRPGHESDQPVATEEGVLRLTRPNPRKPIASSGHDPQGSRLYGPATKQLYSFANYGQMYGRRTVTS